MGAPQIILIILYTLSIICNGFLHGRPKEGTYNVGAALLSTAITFGLLVWGGFFK